MRILLDSTYFLTYFRIAVDGLAYDFLKNLMNKQDLSILISEISFSELVAKYCKLNLLEQKTTAEEIVTALDAIKYESQIEKLSWIENPKIIELMFELRKIHSDFFDCIIFASAIVEADIIGTFDKTFYNKIKKSSSVVKKINELNPEFQFWFFDFKEKLEKLIFDSSNNSPT